MRGKRLILLTLLLLALVPGAATADIGIYARVLQVYQTNGSVPPCQFTSAQLQAALKGVDTYGEQYFADFTNAIQTALASRASGVCAPGGASSQAREPSVAASGFTPPPVTGSSGADLPAPILVLAGVSLAVALATALAALGRAWGWDPRWIRLARHGAGEAGYRAAGFWIRRTPRRR